jgi:hypothetical protein
MAKPPEKPILWINNHPLNAGIRQRRTSEMANACWETKRLQRPISGKYKVAKRRKLGTGFECQIRKHLATAETALVNEFDR